MRIYTCLAFVFYYFWNPPNWSAIKKKILFIDDEASLQHIISLVFEDFNVQGLLEGKHAVDIAKTFQPDVAIIDIALRDTDGRHLCNAIKAEPLTAHIPVILITATIEDENEVPCKPDARVLKPFDIEDLQTLVFKLMNKN